MRLPDEIKSSIASKSTFLRERVQAPPIVLRHDVGCLWTEGRLRKWSQVCAAGRWSLFENRLSWDELTADIVQKVIAPFQIAATKLPSWVEVLASALECCAEFDAGRFEDGDGQEEWFFNADDPLPFEEVTWPFLTLAVRRLNSAAGSSYESLAQPVQAVLLNSLAQHLSRLASATLHHEMGSPERDSASGSDPHQQQAYSRFVTGLYQGGFIRLFSDYPVLGKLMATATEQWVAAYGELLRRLQSDRRDIANCFSEGRELGQIVNLAAGLSDRHNGGRSVCAIAFASGLRVVYKPKDISLEKHFGTLLDWLNEQEGDGLDLRSARTLPREGYGWVAYVAQQTCHTASEATAYYRRCGSLLALMHVLRGNDCHQENLIASGDHPLVVDLETLFLPEFTDVSPPAQTFFKSSVLSVGMLPDARFGHEQDMYDISGLGGVESGSMQFQTMRWVRNRSQPLNPEIVPLTTRLHGNVATLEGVTLIPEDFEDAIITGYLEMGRKMMRCKDSLLNSSGPLAAFKNQMARMVPRPTQLYGILLRKTLHPEHLRDGASFSIQFDVLSRPWINAETRPRLWAMRQWEQASLEQMDVPLFSLPIDSTALPLPDGTEIAGYASKSGFEAVKERVQNLDEAVLQSQVPVIRSVLRLHSGRLPAEKSSGCGQKPETSSEDDRRWLEGQALKLADVVEQTAVHIPGHGPSWLTFICPPGSPEFHLEFMGENLYDGRAGVALFLSAAAAVSGERRYVELATETLRSIQSSVEQGQAGAALGACSGLGSLLYTFVTCSELLGSEEVMSGASAVLSALDFEKIGSDTNYDITAGSAGALLALLRYHRANPSREALDKADSCVRHLIKNRVPDGAGLRAWQTQPLSQARYRDKLYSGFSHGAAGIALALARLYSLTGDTTARDAALEAIAFENRLFDSEEGNWRHFENAVLPDGKPLCQSSWCYGAPGIGLARLGMMSCLDLPELEVDVRRALPVASMFQSTDVDHLCCGTLGRASMVRAAAEQLADPTLMEAAHGLILGTARKAAKQSAWMLHRGLPRQPQTPGFFQGLSGIGYELLRVAHPGRLPSVLSLE